MTIKTTTTIVDDFTTAISSSKPSAVPYFIFNGSQDVQDLPVVLVSINQGNPQGHCFLTGSMASYDVYNVTIQYQVVSQGKVTSYDDHKLMVHQIQNNLNDCQTLNDALQAHTVLGIEGNGINYNASTEDAADMTSITHNLMVLINSDNFYLE